MPVFSSYAQDAVQQEEKPCGALRLIFESETPKQEGIDDSVAQRDAKILGTQSVPHQGYGYEIIPGELDGNGVYHATFHIVQPNPDMMHTMMIQTMMIDSTMSIPAQAKGIDLLVDKDFNWGPESFSTVFDETHENYCLQENAATVPVNPKGLVAQ